MESASFNLVLDCVAAKRLPLILNNRPETIDIKKTITLKVCSSTTTTTLPLPLPRPPPPPPSYRISLRKVNDMMLPFLTFKRNSQVPLRYTNCTNVWQKKERRTFLLGDTQPLVLLHVQFIVKAQTIFAYIVANSNQNILTKLMKSE